MQILSTSLSALNSSTTRLNVTANNIANSNTPDFKQKSVNLQEAPNSSGVQVQNISTSTAPSDLQNNNVNLNEQMVSLINEKNDFTFNVKGLKVADDMIGSLLNVKA